MTVQPQQAPPRQRRAQGLSFLVHGHAKAGKALALDTPLPTPDGWTTIGDVRPGDLLFNDHGELTRVVAVSPVWFGRPCREVRLRGESIIADVGHVWKMSNSDNTPGQWRLGETDDLVSAGRRALPWTPCLRLADIDLPVHPYVLGAWLGDGSTDQPLIHGSDLKMPVLLRCLELWGSGEIRERNGHPVLFLPKLIPAMRAAGAVLDDHKHVPSQYLRAGDEQRRELLAGLLDTDGYVVPKMVTFTNTNMPVVEAVCELAHTLGIRAEIFGPKKSFASADGVRTQGLDHYDVNLRGVERRHGITHRPDSLSKIPEKRVKRFDRIYVQAVTETKSVPVRCIQVDDLHGMFLAGRSMVPTHNSTFADSGPVPRVVLDVEGSSYWTPSRKIYWDPMRQPAPQPDGSWDTAIVLVREARTVMEVYRVLNSGQHPFNSGAMDSVTEVQQRVIDDLARGQQMDRQKWGDLLRQVNAMVRAYRDLITHPVRPLWSMTFVAGTHQKDGRWRPMLQGQAQDYLPYYVDVLGYLDARTDGLRQMLIGPNPSFETGERLGGRLPYVMQIGDASHPGYTIESMLAQVLQGRGN